MDLQYEKWLKACGVFLSNGALLEDESSRVQDPQKKTADVWRKQQHKSTGAWTSTLLSWLKCHASQLVEMESVSICFLSTACRYRDLTSALSIRLQAVSPGIEA